MGGYKFSLLDGGPDQVLAVRGEFPVQGLELVENWFFSSREELVCQLVHRGVLSVAVLLQGVLWEEGVRRGVYSVEGVRQGVLSVQGISRGVFSVEEVRQSVPSVEGISRGVLSVEELRQSVLSVEGISRGVLLVGELSRGVFSVRMTRTAKADLTKSHDAFMLQLK